MQFLRYRNYFIITGLLVAASILSFLFVHHERSIDFDAQVKPILNKKCIFCHGGVRKKGGFSLLFRDEAIVKGESGKFPIIPGDPDHSEMIRRLTLRDPEDRMPYRHEPLSKDEINNLKRWIREGAVWGEHWAYKTLEPVDVPVPQAHFFGLIPGKKLDWVRNDIDYFIDQKLREQRLVHSSEAGKAELLRRASLDLIGMPAPDGLAERFLNDSSDKAYSDLLDSLMASPHYGERWASMWLDLARYADTKGYERDDSRSIWRYRDWLIGAFNKDEAYDSFIIEQLAGDLLPNPSDANYIATAFHRNTMTNDEGGTDNEEFRTAAVMDRVNTTWEALMGTTFGCVQCHSHPYDPFTHDEYYKFLAFFNDTRDEDSYADYPLLRSYPDTLETQLKRLCDWVNQNAGARRAGAMRLFLKTWQPAYNSLNCDNFTNSELSDTKWAAFRNHAICRLKNVELTGRKELIYRFSGYKMGGIWEIHADKPDGALLARIRIDTSRKEGWEIAWTPIQPMEGSHSLYFSYVNSNLKKPTETGAMIDWLYFAESFPGKGLAGYEKMKQLYWKLLTANVPTTPVMMDNPAYMHRASHVFERGNWLVKGKLVEADVPHSLNPLVANTPHNRMGLALWMVDPKNPLTSRTIVNRIWEQLFGTGLAETLEDLGTQGIPPSHPELLDWLSYRFMTEDHWSLKKLLKGIMLSASYRQDSRLSAEMMQRDPQNKWLERGPRVRLSAEQVRDQALCISGLLNGKVGGPSIFPYQPKGIWLSPWNNAQWVASSGDSAYRRAIYTYWKRSSGYPSMLTFDAASREVCTARRIRTNTPLQALVTLNDSAYLDLARHFAFRMQKEGGTDVKKEIARGYEIALYKPISKEKLNALTSLYELAYEKMNNDRVRSFEMIGEKDGDGRPATAALVLVANALFNLDELITKN